MTNFLSSLSDRISAFDVILGDPIPKKGKILTALTDFWFKELDGIVPNHLTGIDPETVVAPEERDQVKGRAVVAKRLKPILIECVARGYISGGLGRNIRPPVRSAASNFLPD